MDYTKKERVQVKLEFLRMLIRMELDPARMTLLAGFFETYLSLNEAEESQLKNEVGKIDEKEAERMMELTTSWQEKGRKEGQVDILLRLLKKKYGDMPAGMENQIRSLPIKKLQELAEAIFELEKLEDVQNFLR